MNVIEETSKKKSPDVSELKNLIKALKNSHLTKSEFLELAGQVRFKKKIHLYNFLQLEENTNVEEPRENSTPATITESNSLRTPKVQVIPINDDKNLSDDYLDLLEPNVKNTDQEQRTIVPGKVVEIVRFFISVR